MKKYLRHFYFYLLPLLVQAQPELIFQLYGGYSWHQSGQIDIELPPYAYQISGIVWDSESFVAPQFYVFSAGYLIDREDLPLRLGFEYIHDKVYAEAGSYVTVGYSNDPAIESGTAIRFSRLVDQYSMAYGYNYLLIKASYPFWQTEIWNRNIRLFAGAGVGMVSTHVASEKDRQQRGQYEWHGPALMVDVAFEYPISHAFILCAGGKYLASRVKQAGIVYDGYLSTTIQSAQAVIGLGYMLK